MSGIRIVLFDELYKTNSLAPSGIELLCLMDYYVQLHRV